ncbi:MAG: tetratricopeptide repeat protein [Synechococcales bacterium]|nr:tetratricopeptide repeat protein [Synechococcales bacterium]
MALNFLRSIWTGSDKPLGGRYQLVACLGEGGFGQTFRAQDLHLPGQPLCVVKQLKPQVKSAQDLLVARRLFDTEAKVLYELGNHPQIPRLLAHFEDNQEFYLAQELIEGHPLSDELTTPNRWSNAQVVALVGDILGTLAFVHQNRVIHRDIKPSNLIRRQRDNRIVLIDFGAVKQVSTQFVSANTGITHTISIGTHGYMPNEQLAGTPQFSSDIYAVGMIGIQALTGRHPKMLAADPRTGEIDWHRHAPQAHAGLRDVLDKMVRYDFRSRYITAADALADLQALPESLSQAIPPIVGFAPPEPSESGEPQAKISLPPPPPPVLPLTQPEANTLPYTEPAPSQSETSPPSQSELPTPGLSQTHPAPPVPAPPVAGPSQPRPTLPLVGRPAGVSLSRSFSPSRSRPSIHTHLVPSRSTLPKAAIPAGAIATLLALGLVTWRACTPAGIVSNNQTLSTSQPADATDAPRDAAPDSPPATDPSATDPSATDPPATEPPAGPPLAERLQRAKELRDGLQYAQALAIYDEAIAQDDTSADAHAGRCYSLNRLGRTEEAIASCDQALALDPNNAQALWSKGYAYDQQKRHQEALTLYDQALAIDPNFAEAWSNKGTALLLLQNSEAALVAFDRAVDLDPELAEAWNNRGAALWNLRRFNEAVDSVDRALAIRPDYADANTLRQEMRNRLGR